MTNISDGSLGLQGRVSLVASLDCIILLKLLTFLQSGVLLMLVVGPTPEISSLEDVLVVVPQGN